MFTSKFQFRDIEARQLERKKRIDDGIPEPKIDMRMDNSVTNILSYFKKHVEDKDKVNDKESYKTIVFSSYVVRLPERYVRRMEEDKRRQAERAEDGRRRAEERKRRDREAWMRQR